jgi:preprotein translocase subunit SecF
MWTIVEKRKIWFTISLIVILPGILFMIWSLATRGQLLPLSIDYTGGTVWEVRFEQPVQPTQVRQVFVDAGYPDTVAYTVNDNQTVQVKFKPVDLEEKQKLADALTETFGANEERSYRSLGPVIGREVSQAAVVAVILASVLIMLYIAWAFRQVPHPFRWGVAAVTALFHDVLVVISFLAIMNLIAGWEVDALTLTAILTVIGYSVNDTVVVFDRIRENVRRYKGESLSTISDRSIIETATRSVGTQITVWLIVLSVLVLGGVTLQQFMATMLVGFVSGMYSSIFNASPIIVAWDERSIFGRKKTKTTSTGSSAGPSTGSSDGSRAVPAA